MHIWQIPNTARHVPVAKVNNWGSPSPNDKNAILIQEKMNIMIVKYDLVNSKFNIDLQYDE